jgi:UDP-glucose 4-epimerase
MNVLITGGGGYIGSHLAHRLIKRGDNVTLIDNESNCGMPRLLEKNYFIADVTNLYQMEQVFAEYSFDAVVHLAANKSMTEDRVLAENLVGTANTFIAANQNSAPIFINASSAAVYGDYDRIVSEIDPCRPTNIYGESKKAAENYLMSASNSKTKVVNLRFFNVAGSSPIAAFGRRWNEEGVCFITAQQIHNGSPIWLHGSKEKNAYRDFIHVEDVCAHIEASIQYNMRERDYICFNVCSGYPVGLEQLAKTYSEVLGMDWAYEFSHQSAGTHFSCGNNEFTNRMLKTGCLYSLEDIVESSLI